MGTNEQTAQRKKAFLERLVTHGNVRRACRESGAPPTSVYEWKDRDPRFAAAFLEAEAQSIGHLEDEAQRRAVEGVDKPIYQGGKQVGVTRQYSDTLLIFLMKARHPGKYRETFQHQHTGDKGGPIEFTLEFGAPPGEEEDA